MLYTGQGDDGTTAQYGDGQRLAKDHPLIVALGSVDELNTLIGVYRHQLKMIDEPLSLTDICQLVQQHLFIIQAALAGADKKITTKHINQLEKIITELEPHIPAVKGFVVPGVTPESARLDHLRAVTRRVEVAVVNVRDAQSVEPSILKYLNRLSSVWYALARAAATSTNVSEDTPKYL